MRQRQCQLNLVRRDIGIGALRQQGRGSEGGRACSESAPGDTERIHSEMRGYEVVQWQQQTLVAEGRSSGSTGTAGKGPCTKLLYLYLTSHFAQSTLMILIAQIMTGAML